MAIEGLGNLKTMSLALNFLDGTAASLAIRANKRLATLDLHGVMFTEHHHFADVLHAIKDSRLESVGIGWCQSHMCGQQLTEVMKATNISNWDIEGVHVTRDEAQEIYRIVGESRHIKNFYGPSHDIGGERCICGPVFKNTGLKGLRLSCQCPVEGHEKELERFWRLDYASHTSYGHYTLKMSPRNWHNKVIRQCTLAHLFFAPDVSSFPSARHAA
jgi:hypothetical protein